MDTAFWLCYFLMLLDSNRAFCFSFDSASFVTPRPKSISMFVCCSRVGRQTTMSSLAADHSDVTVRQSGQCDVTTPRPRHCRVSVENTRLFRPANRAVAAIFPRGRRPGRREPSGLDGGAQRQQSTIVVVELLRAGHRA